MLFRPGTVSDDVALLADVDLGIGASRALGVRRVHENGLDAFEPVI